MQWSSVSPEIKSKVNDPQAAVRYLRKIALFKNFSEDELKKIYQKGELRVVEPQAYAVIEGEPSRGLFIIVEGKMSVFKSEKGTDKMHRIANLDALDSFGEMSLFDAAPRSATIAADTLCYLFHIDAEAFDAYLSGQGDNAKYRFYKACAEDLSERFRAINADYIASQKLLWEYALRKNED
ncbi:MAG: cyclic nucleotide-binding domain-containing protein [Oligoflexales bacterium]